MRFKLRWAVLSPILLLSLTLGGCSKKSSLEGVEGMATMAPGNAAAFVGFDVRKTAEWEKFISSIDQLSEEPKLTARFKMMESQLGGMKITDLVQGIDPAGWSVILDPEGKGQLQDLALVVALLERDRKHLQACISQVSKNGKPTTTEVEGVQIDTYTQGFSTCFHKGFVLVSNSSKGLETVLKSKDEPLAQQADFKAARQRVLDGKADVFAYVPTSALVAFGSEYYQSLGGKLDEAQTRSLTSFKYLAGGVKGEAPFDPIAFVAVDGQASTPLVKALLTSPNSAHSTAEVVPADWAFYMMTQAGYQMRLFAAASQSSPDGKKVLDQLGQEMADFGASPKDLDAAFTGEVALALDLTDYFAVLPQTPPNGMLVFGAKDDKSGAMLIRKLASANGLQLKSRKAGDATVTTVDGIPWMMVAQRAKPYPTISLVFGAKPEEVLSESTALTPGKSLHDTDPFKSIENPANLFTLNYDLRATMKQLAASGLLDMTPDLAPLKSAIEGYETSWWQGYMAAQVAQDGITAHGAPSTMMVASVFAGAMAVVAVEPELAE